MDSAIIRRVVQIYHKSIEWVAATILILVSVSMLEVIVARNFLNTPFSMLDFINVIAMMWACFLMVGPLTETENHIAVTFVPSKLTGLRLAFLRLFIHLANLAAFFITGLFGFLAFRMIYEMGTVYNAEIAIPQWWAVLPICIGMILAIPSALHVMTKEIILISRELRDRNRAGRGKP